MEASLDALAVRARAVGRTIGWDLELFSPPNPAYVGLTAGPGHVVVLGPMPASEAEERIGAALSMLENGAASIVVDSEGDPRMGGPIR